MPVKFYKTQPKQETQVFGSGYAYGPNDREEFVIVQQGSESVTVTTADVPALIDAIHKAAEAAKVEADKSKPLFSKEVKNG